MNIDLQIIKNRSMILCGGSYEGRAEAIGAVRTIFLKELRGSVFILPESIKDANKYLKSVLHEFPIERAPRGTVKSAGYDELNDAHLNWVAQFKNVLVIIPEFQKLYENDSAYFFELLERYLTKQRQFTGRKRFRFFVTLSEAVPIEFGRLATDRDLACVNLPESGS